MYHWPGPRSLAATNGVSFDVLSSGYLDVSVPRVRFKPLWIQDLIPSLTSRSVTPAPDRGHPQTGANLTIRKVEGGFPHSEIPGSKLVRSSPRLIAAYHVLHRLSAPRHPPNALKALDRSHDRCSPSGSAAKAAEPNAHTVTKRPVTDRFRDRSQLLAEHDRRRSALAAPTATFPLHDVTLAIPPGLRPRGTAKRCALSGWCLPPHGPRHPSTPLAVVAPCGAPHRGRMLEQDGGDRRDRTDDLMLAKHALSQLSYVP